MNYEAEKIAATLKAAREKRGLSQRELIARAGVPQSHISKIENAGVNLRISSLAAIANALGLEIALVPRKAVSAVKTIARNIDDVPRGTRDVRNELARIHKQLDSIKNLNIEPQALEVVRRHVRELEQFQNLIREPEALRSVRDALKAVDNTGALKALREASDQTQRIRNLLAHSGVMDELANAPRPAYRLDGDDDA